MAGLILISFAACGLTTPSESPDNYLLLSLQEFPSSASSKLANVSPSHASSSKIPQVKAKRLLWACLIVSGNHITQEHLASSAIIK